MSKKIRVLVVDDSALMRKLIPQVLQRDPSIEVVGTAMDGAIGLKKIDELHPHVVTLDIDMPRMDGIELVSLITKDPNLKSVPVMIVSYKDRDEDRQRGLEAGAAYYLTKGSFHDETLLQAVVDLIGEPDA
jgi:two-component system, chemotaxis family, sensor histidine kinase and response regulator WspE